ncbi:uncharacterized protein Dwil_GK21119 [Drosophila willistoni]|uniref:Uncharacterized protein n=1 Tax=Drosophila willistoni TaxID=7260 RepID=A0A0Q9WSN8_DROWI|nr:uncharacterized protein LOC26530047 [Drosophila willistoni]KRF99258.1 uncharacterized protein Dwil_GK21119 [Drosophila willistoni]
MKSGRRGHNCGPITCCPAKIGFCLPLMPPTHDELSWINVNIKTPHRRCCPCSTVWTNEFRFWCRRNSNMIINLSDKLGKSAEDVAVFLYELTLQNYSQIMNPKKSGWNQCNRVPFTQPFVCDGFLSTFDERGNLRNPMNPRSLKRLLRIFQSLTTDEPNDITHGSIGKIGSAFKKEEQTSVFGYDEDQRSISDNKVRDKFTLPSPLEDDELNQLTNQFKPFNRRRASAIGAMENFQDSMIRLMDEKGRRRGKGSNAFQLGALRGKSAQFLRFLISRVNEQQSLTEEPNDVIKAIDELHLHQSANRRKRGKHRNKRDVDNIADHYNAVVSKEIGKDRYGLRLKPSPQTNTFGQSANELKALQTGKERRYFAEQIPVLYHEPYDGNNISSWMRRHPNQLRLLADGRITTGGLIRRYRRESVQRAWEKADRRYSLHSLVSLGRNSVKEQPMFGRMSLTVSPEMQRIFPTTDSGKKLQSKTIKTSSSRK